MGCDGGVVKKERWDVLTIWGCRDGRSATGKDRQRIARYPSTGIFLKAENGFSRVANSTAKCAAETKLDFVRRSACYRETLCHLTLSLK